MEVLEKTGKGRKDQVIEEKFFQLNNGKVITDERLAGVMAVIDSVKPEETKPLVVGYEWSEMGMGDLFAECYKNYIRYCNNSKTWYVYTDGKWQKDVGSCIIESKAKEFVRMLTIYAANILDDDLRKDWLSLCGKMNDRRYRTRMLEDAKSECHINESDFDAHPNLVNCLNGTFDLDRMTFREHDWRDFLTMQTKFSFPSGNVFAMDYDQIPRCERWEKFISEVMCGNKEKAQYLQKALGYSLRGDASEECMFILYGATTRNGKSTTLNTIQHLMGDYAAVSPVSIICKSQKDSDGSGASPMIVTLKGRRIVTMAESNQYGRLDEEAIKQMTGGESITARGLYSQPITFKPQFTMFLSCNDLPAVRDRSVFASERLRVIQFDRHFTQEEQDRNLKHIFESAEAMPGIFAWLLAGYERYRTEGLQMPEVVKSVVDKYEKDNDLIMMFMEQNTEPAEGRGITAKGLYDRFKLWAKSNNMPVLSSKKFVASLDAHPMCYEKIVYTNNKKTYKGIDFRTE